MTGAGLSPDAVDAILAPLAYARTLLIAVSGGPDSTALLLMSAAWARRRGAIRLEAATVDHGLRPEGVEEAAAVAALCERIGVPHVTLRWIGDKPSTRLQERAREARYALLAARAREIGAEAIVTAHHLDDQAETVLFRLLRGSGIAGLSGISAFAARDGVTIARPLLPLSKTELVAYCEAQGVAFARDPSNDDDRYARTRMRSILKSLAQEGLDAPALARLARRASRIDEALTRAAIEAERNLGIVDAGACAAGAWLALPAEIAQRVLARAIARVGGRDESRVGLEKVETLEASLRAALQKPKRFSANVAGARVRGDGKGRIWVEKEPARRS